jgi:UDP-2-acetamido-3-amino-2,3-dideoxy-glucuronate N-acetyltransferase
MSSRISNLASVSNSAVLGIGVTIWDFSKVRENSTIGDSTLIGDHVYIDVNVKIGKNCKIQNSSMLFDPCRLHDGVFIGPGVILTNDRNPRSITSLGVKKSAKDWVKTGVEVLIGASIGAGAICIAPVKIGRWSMIGAGSVVTKNVPDFALVLGNPARQVGWVGKAGERLDLINDLFYLCPLTNEKYVLQNGSLTELKV